MATYLIDYENVKSEGIKGVAQLGEDDRVVIFYSHNADTITFEAMDMIFSSKAQISKYKILCGGKNALDFQLSTYLGYLIHEAKDSYFYIISKDNGFKHVVDFWKRTFQFDGYVYCFATIADGNARQNRFKNATAKERAREMEEELVAMSEELEAQSDAEEAEDAEATEDVQKQENIVSEDQQEQAEEILAESVLTAQVVPTDETAQDERAEEAFDSVPLTEQPNADVAESERVSEEKESEIAEASNDAEETGLPKEEIKSVEEDDEILSTMIYSVEQHKPVSVMPPAELPDSVRKELEKADIQYPKSSEEDLKEKIAAAVSASTVKVIESGMTIHHVEESESAKEDNVKKTITPEKADKVEKTEKITKTEKKNKGEEISKSEKNVHHTRHLGRRKKNIEQTAENAASILISVDEEAQGKEKVPKTSRTPKTVKIEKNAKIEEQSKEIGENEKIQAPKETETSKEMEESKIADRKPRGAKPVRTAKKPKKADSEAENVTEEKPAKPARKSVARRARKETVAAVPSEEVTAPPVQEVQEKPVRRGRRPKAQSNIAANFE